MLRQLIMLLEGEIRCTHAAPGTADFPGERFGPPFQSFLVETGKELEAHKSLTVQEVWKEQLTLGRKKFHLNRQEYEELLEFGGMLGYLDIQMQTELCLWYEERLKISGAGCHVRGRRKTTAVSVSWNFKRRCAGGIYHIGQVESKYERDTDF